MNLPEELACLSKFDKYIPQKTMDCDLGNGDIFTFKLLSTDEQIDLVSKTSAEASMEDPVHYYLCFQRNLLAYSLVAVDGTPLPKATTEVHDDEGKVLGTMFSLIRAKMGALQDEVFQNISHKVQKFQGKAVSEMFDSLGLKFEDVNLKSAADYEQELQQIKEQEDEILQSQEQHYYDDEYFEQQGSQDGYQGQPPLEPEFRNSEHQQEFVPQTVPQQPQPSMNQPMRQAMQAAVVPEPPMTKEEYMNSQRGHKIESVSQPQANADQYHPQGVSSPVRKARPKIKR